MADTPRTRNKSWLSLCNEADRNAEPPGNTVRKEIIPVYEFAGVGNQNTFYEVGSGYDIGTGVHARIIRLNKSRF